MKKFAFILSITLVLGFSTFGNAILIDYGGGLIYDTDFNITWYANALSPGRYGIDYANTWATGLNIGGVTGWRLPTALNQDGTGPCTGGNCTGSEMGHLYYVELGNTSTGGIERNTGPFSNLMASVDGEFSRVWYYSTFPGWENSIADYDDFWTPGEVFHKGYTTYFYNGAQIFYYYTPDVGGYDLFGALAVHDGNVVAPEPAAVWLLCTGLIGLFGGYIKFSK